MGDDIADHERAALLALLTERPAMLGERAGKTSWSTIASEVALRGSALAVWHDTRPDLPPTLDFGDPPAAIPDVPRLDIAWTQVGNQTASADFRMVTVLDEDYPHRLRAIHQMPPVLFVRGELRADERGVSIVGSRRATARGLAIAAHVAESLVRGGFSVIAGLAEGIDGAAHEATLAAGGRPIGVIGTGITQVYPAQHRVLHERVAAAGALVSQFLPDAPPTKQSFPMRNATMSGLGLASVIIEAGEHSGTRVQARVALEHGRPVIFTDTVVHATTWARDMLDRPGVYVASSTTEVMSIVERLAHTADADDAEVLPALADPPDGR